MSDHGELSRQCLRKTCPRSGPKDTTCLCLGDNVSRHNRGLFASLVDYFDALLVSRTTRSVFRYHHHPPPPPLSVPLTLPLQPPHPLHHHYYPFLHHHHHHVILHIILRCICIAVALRLCIAICIAFLHYSFA